MLLGGAFQGRGDETEARAAFQESLELVRHEGRTWRNKLTVVYDLAGMARLAAAEGHLERAVRLYGASEALRSMAPLPLAPPEHELRERFLLPRVPALATHLWSSVVHRAGDGAGGGYRLRTGRPTHPG